MLSGFLWLEIICSKDLKQQDQERYLGISPVIIFQSNSPVSEGLGSRILIAGLYISSIFTQYAS